MLADQFIEGARSTGNEVEKIALAGKNIQFCKGCLACQKLGRCVISDDVNDIMDKVLEADVVCWATPIYYYEMSGQMKTLIDRMNAMYPKGYRFRDVYLLSTATEGGHWQFLGWSDGPTETPRQILVTSDTAIVALFEWVADSTQGINDILSSDIKVYSLGGRIVVEGADGETVHIFDMMGRTIHNEALPTGVYMVKVGEHPSRKSVIR